MILRDIYSICILVANDTYVRSLAVLVTVSTLTISLLLSPLAGLIIYCSYIIGYFVGWFLVKYQEYASVYICGIINFCSGLSSHRSIRHKIKSSCSICDDLSCKRHQTGESVAPWKYLLIDKELNEAVEHFYNRILDNFITSWYGTFTNDVDFVNELRYCLRYATSNVINRFLEIEQTKIISTKLFPHTVKHVDDFLYMQQIVKLKNVRLNDVIIEYLGKRLHPATTNRKTELAYLQHLSACIMQHILPEKYRNCNNFSVLIREILTGWVLLPLMDVLADPNIINSLVILGCTYKSKKSHLRKNNPEKVEFMGSFMRGDIKKSPFAIDLQKIRQNTELLYTFMQFLKREDHVYLLQFCLDVDEFNNKLLTPDLSKKQLEELHSEALKLYREYLSEDSVNFVGCPKEILNSFYSVISGGVYNVAKLRTSKPLYQAYEHTLNILENIWLPSFFHSNEFYSHLCGSKVTAAYVKASANRNKKYYESQSSQVANKISTGIERIRGALQTAKPIDGAVYSGDPLQNFENGGGIVGDIIISECSSIFRDLSAWRVSIMSYQMTNKVLSFCINVQRLDAVDDGGKRHWVILRKDQDFYTLKAKLVEFHGEGEICDSPLPSRKAGSSIDMRMSKYEDFLKRLLLKPSLRGSDLLYTFLTAEVDFSTVIAMSAQNAQDIGNIYQSVAHKLRKEKGQHLDSFMSTFLLSTGKTKSGKFEWGEIGDEADVTITSRRGKSPMPKTFRNHVFNDNFGITFKLLKDTSSSSFNPIGDIQCIFYLLKYVFKVPYCILKLYAAICSVTREAVEYFFSSMIERNIKSNLSPHNLSELIKLLEGVIFDLHISSTKEELLQRKVRAFSELEHIVPPYMEKILGVNFKEGLKTLLDILQHPHYNKQLAYNFLDLIVSAMYPEIGQV